MLTRGNKLDRKQANDELVRAWRPLVGVSKTWDAKVSISYLLAYDKRTLFRKMVEKGT